MASFLLFAPQQLMGQDCHAVDYDQARLCLLLITNMMALSIFTELPQYFITDFFRLRNVYGLPPKPHLTALQPSNILC